MTETDPIHFFDLWSSLPGPGKSWSPNTLRTRMVLNFKGIPYTQSWVSYPDIAPLLKAHGVPPGTSNTPYTLPAISHKGIPDGMLMDSEPIAMYIDKLYPSPPLFPSGDASYALEIAVLRSIAIFGQCTGLLITPRVPSVLDERGREYFVRTRSERFGKPLSEVRPTDEEGLGELWELLEKESLLLVKMLKGKEGKKGPFLEGEKAGYADIILASMLAFLDRFDRDIFEKILGLGDGEFKRFYEACLPWLEGQGEEKEWPIPQ
ncbi:hypothetical protein N7457_005846 [Penicillium paradoxum]|uniref:uncharacterized protein n=1 Tax=Penicillium paradoxum TaxID=176176 RepID=UPI00254758E1|nr:uncharacterized protein N7457_005846 [Penicillium paradoxum]KAJ5780686.1 hypothetical protein N7457_005846 [Penicillium paradoxum]